ncbi:MAG: TraR/DksA C4-type zinc finger protein [Halioglobus sp.]
MTLRSGPIGTYVLIWIIVGRRQRYMLVFLTYQNGLIRRQYLMAYESLKSELEQRLVDMQSRLLNIKKDVTKAYSGDSAEQAQERENDEVVEAIGNETRQAISDLKAALSRIDDGSYGVCEGCGEAIGEARLAALPEAPRCVVCSA